jgi:hypothetical protein
MPIYTRAYDPNGTEFGKMWRLLQQDYTRRRDNYS